MSHDQHRAAAIGRAPVDHERLGLACQLQAAADRVRIAVESSDELELIRALTAADRARVAILLAGAL